jgi:very-short-patch-repair endonuclease
MNFLGKWAKLYSNLTDAEKALEPAIASLGVPYRVQHPLWALSVFPDFVLLNERLVIEVDDDGHKKPAKKRADALRTQKIERLGWRVVRCWNDEALTNPYATVDRLMRDAGLTIRSKRN